MSIFSFMFGARYDKGSELVSSEVVESILRAHPLLKDCDIYLKDGKYLLLEESRLRDFVAEHSWAITQRYKAEVFDCDDFAACARADLLRDGARQGFDASILVAELIHVQKKGGRHDALILMAKGGLILYFEPQTSVCTKNIGDQIAEAETLWG